MISLDQFKVVRHAPHGACYSCGKEGSMFAFWERHVDAGMNAPDQQVCVECLFKTDGRFKNEHPVQILRRFEEVTSVNVSEELVEIGTRSPFGYFFHVYYIEKTLCATSEEADLVPSLGVCQQLSENSEVFDENGETVANQSAYTEIAMRLVDGENGDQLQAGA